jgi:hypothetical protein
VRLHKLFRMAGFMMMSVERMLDCKGVAENISEFKNGFLLQSYLHNTY